MTDIWVCSTCHSINRQRVSRCYKCGASRDEATGEMEDLRVERAIQTRTVVPYRSSWLRALIASGFILAVAGLNLILLVLSYGLTAYVRDQLPTMVAGGGIDETALAEHAAVLIIPGLLQFACGIGALLFFGAWLSRVVTNIPALGGGAPNTTPTKAFIYPLIPVLNLIKVPGMMQDALYRLDPKAGGFFMALLAWIGLVGSAIVSFLADLWVNLRIPSVLESAKTLDEAIAGVTDAYDIRLIVDEITTVMVAVGAVVLVVLIWRIEARAARRDREIRGAAAETVEVAASPVTGVESPAIGAADPSTTGAAFVASVASAGLLAGTTDDEPRFETQPTVRPSPAPSGASSIEPTMAPLTAAATLMAAAEAPPQTVRPPQAIPPPQAAVSPAASPAQEPFARGPWAWRDTTDSPGGASQGAAAVVTGPGWDPEVHVAAVEARPPAPIPGAEPAVVAESAAVTEPAPVSAQRPEPAPTAESSPEASPDAGLPGGRAGAIEAEPTVSPEPEPAALPAQDDAPHLTIRVVSGGMLQAELSGDSEPVILEDLEAYGAALAKAGGTAEIVVAGSDGMATLIARRAQSILAEAGIQATMPD
jgi:hypothetical protein